MTMITNDTKITHSLKVDNEGITLLPQELVSRILAQYEIGNYKAHLPLGGGYKNLYWLLETDKGRFFLKLNRVYGTHIRELANFEMELSKFINNEVKRRAYDWSVPFIYSTHKGQGFTELDGHAFMVYEYVQGEFAPWEASGGVRLQPTTALLAELHSILADYPGEVPSFKRNIENAYHDIPRRLQELKELYGSLRSRDHNLNENQKKFFEIFDDLNSALEKLVQLLPPSAYAALPKQLVHLDFAPIHIMYQCEKPILVIDWENTNVDTRLVDFVKGIAPFHSANRYAELIDMAAFYQIGSAKTSNPLSYAELRALPFIHIAHRIKFIALHILKQGLGDENREVDWALVNIRAIIDLMTIDFSSFADRVENRVKELENEESIYIEQKKSVSENLLKTYSWNGYYEISHDNKEPKFLIQPEYWEIGFSLKQDAYIHLGLKPQEPIDMNGYAKLEMDLVIEDLQEQCKANQHASFDIRFRYKGMNQFVEYVTPPLVRGNHKIIMKIPGNLGLIDELIFHLNGGQTTIRELKTRIQSLYLMPEFVL